MVAEKENDHQWTFDYPLSYNSVPITYGLYSCNTGVSYSRQRFPFQALASLTSLRTKSKSRTKTFLYFFFKSSEEGRPLRGFVCGILTPLPAVKICVPKTGP